MRCVDGAIAPDSAEIAAGRRWSLHKLSADIEPAAVPPDPRNFAQSIGEAAARLNVMDANYMIGVLYTTMIPAKAGAALGAYGRSTKIRGVEFVDVDG